MNRYDFKVGDWVKIMATNNIGEVGVIIDFVPSSYRTENMAVVLSNGRRIEKFRENIRKLSAEEAFLYLMETA